MKINSSLQLQEEQVHKLQIQPLQAQLFPVAAVGCCVLSTILALGISLAG